MKKMLEVINVSKSFYNMNCETKVLKNVSCGIDKGEFISIMGSSGSGKSTLLYLMGGLDEPTQGTIKFNDKELSQMSDKNLSITRRSNIGFIFQFYNLLPNMSTEDNILLPLYLSGKKVKNCEKQLADVIEIVGLSDKRRNKPGELSGGQQQRVAIARALIYEPEMILADEPTGNLGSQNSEDIMKLFKKINIEKSTTIVMVTHSTECASYASRILTMKDGCLI